MESFYLGKLFLATYAADLIFVGLILVSRKKVFLVMSEDSFSSCLSIFGCQRGRRDV